MTMLSLSMPPLPWGWWKLISILTIISSDFEWRGGLLINLFRPTKYREKMSNRLFSSKKATSLTLVFFVILNLLIAIYSWVELTVIREGLNFLDQEVIAQRKSLQSNNHYSFTDSLMMSQSFQTTLDNSGFVYDRVQRLTNKIPYFLILVTLFYGAIIFFLRRTQR